MLWKQENQLLPMGRAGFCVRKKGRGHRDCFLGFQGGVPRKSSRRNGELARCGAGYSYFFLEKSNKKAFAPRSFRQIPSIATVSVTAQTRPLDGFGLRRCGALRAVLTPRFASLPLKRPRTNVLLGLGPTGHPTGVRFPAPKPSLGICRLSATSPRVSAAAWVRNASHLGSSVLF